ncbi:hypothetical protein IKF87_00125 [Candidatus Saccharibacteria bacterium]|nr:hypothetical protein [Candidatus Saccharibacteria bacterium]
MLQFNHKQEYNKKILNMKRTKTLATLSLTTLLISLFIFGMGLSDNADALTYQSGVGVNFTFNPTITINVGGDLVINELTPGSSADSNIISVGVTTNASYGYNLSATVGQKNGTDALVNGSDSTKTFTNLSTTAGTASALSNFGEDTWGYSYSVDNGSNWLSGSIGSTASGYAGLPLDNNNNANERGKGGVTLISTTDPADSKSVRFKIGARASQSQPAGTYTNTINFYAVTNPEPELGPISCPAGKICYNVNSLTPTEGEMGMESATNNSSTTLWASNFKKPGYGFAGWNTSYDYSGTNYGPNQTITAPSDIESSGLSLYAIWVPSAGDLQNWNGCSNLSQGSVTALKDSRDNNVYAVAKLADNKCWTIENLRLDDSAILSSTNTHNPSLPLINSDGVTLNHLSPSTDPALTAWCTTSSSSCVDQSMLATNNTVNFTANTSSAQGNDIYSYGNYYNWYSATAGHGTYSKSSGNTSGDICPAGWHLPTGGSAPAEFGALDVAMGGTGAYQSTAEASNRWRTYPNNFVYSGHVNSKVFNRNSIGFYLSSLAYNSDSAYFLIIDRSYVHPSVWDNGKHYGRTVRCVAGA